MTRAVACVLAAMIPAPALACRLALALAIDVSTSVDQRDYTLQRDGLATALRAEEVQAAFLSARAPVALAAYEWSGARNQRIILDWRLIESGADLDEAAIRISTFVRYRSGYPTSLGNALRFGDSLLDRAPDCERKTLDVSGDGRNNDGITPGEVYAGDGLAGVTVNALAVGGGEPLDSLARYFEREVIRGPGAFVEMARSHEDFERAIRKKLVREVSALVVSGLGTSE